MNSGLQIIENVLPGMIQYIPMTLVYTLVPSVIAALLAIAICKARLKERGVAYWLVSLFVSFFRGTPQLVQLFLILYGLPRLFLLIGIDISDLSAGTFYIIATALNLSCFVAEAYRGGYLAMDYRQIEAGYSIGYSRWQCFLHVIVPGTLQNAVLNLKNLSIDVLKGASLAYTIGAIEVMGYADRMIGLNSGVGRLWVLGTAAVIYFVLCAILETLFNLAARHYERYGKAI